MDTDRHGWGAGLAFYRKAELKESDWTPLGAEFY